MGTFPKDEVDEKQIIKHMVGREIGEIFNRPHKNKIGEKVLEVRNLTRKGAFTDISFSLHEGEVLGLSGLMGSQRTEVCRAIFGLDSYDSGEIFYLGKKINFRHPREAIKVGFAMVPEDRKRSGILKGMSITDNTTISSLPVISNLGWVPQGVEETITRKQVDSLDIKIVSVNQHVEKLSGGNQQKVVVGRGIALKPKILILDEPTRGVDVGAKSEVHKIIEQISSQGVAVIMISSELPEILGSSDRIIVLHQGRITDEFTYGKASQEDIMESALK